MIEIKGKYTSAKIMIDFAEDSCVDQITSFVNHPVFTNPIAIMSDCHTGKGSCIGFTMKLSDRIIPAIVGVDIGCGLSSVCLGTDSLGSLEDLDRKLRQRIPFGENIQDKPVLPMEDFPWHEVQVMAEKFCLSYQNEYGVTIIPPKYSMEWLEEKMEHIGGNLRRVINSIGTVGGSNHFLEVGVTPKGVYWATVHTGSRNFGKRICEYWQNKAIKFHDKSEKTDKRELVAKLKQEFQGKELYDKLKALKEVPPPVRFPDEQLWLEGEDAHGYLMDMLFAQVYATMNRNNIVYLMMNAIGAKGAFASIETVHNYIDFNDFIIRKGSIRSYVGETFLIPYNMRDGILVCGGKSNPEWNCSAPHGAGRFMSRSKARANISLDTFKQQMQGIYSTSVGKSTLDEAPDAYKNPQIIEEAIGPTVTILDRIVPVMNLKDSSGENDDG